MARKNGPNLRKGEWQSTLLSVDSSIQQAIEILNQVALKIVLVTDSSGRLNGTVSDGDIRRGLLQGFNLHSQVSQILNPQPLVAQVGSHRDTIASLMRTNRIQQIPIVNKDRQVVGLHTWESLDLEGKRPNLFVIMAGGEGKRLYPHTEKCPKPMIRLQEKPILEHIITKAKKEGFSQFVIAIHHLGNVIEKYFGNGRDWAVDISYCREKSPMGTAGALRLIQGRTKEAMLVSNGDILADFKYSDLLDFRARSRAAATMEVRSHTWENPFGVIETDGIQIMHIHEKPTTRSIVNTGVYAVDPTVLRHIPKSKRMDMTAFFRLLKSKKLLTVAYPVHEFWLDVGNPYDLQKAKRYISKKREMGDAKT